MHPQNQSKYRLPGNCDKIYRLIFTISFSKAIQIQEQGVLNLL